VTDDVLLGRRERRAAETRAAIVGAARTLFEEQGFADTTVDEIAARADIAPRTFFRYFATKEAVLFADYEELHRGLLDSIRHRPADEPPLRALLAALLDHCGAVEERLERLSWAMHHAELCRGAGVEPALLKARTTSEVADALAQRSGVDPLVDPRPAAWAGAALACFGAAVRAVVHNGGDVRSRFWALVTTTGDELRRAVDDIAGGGPPAEGENCTLSGVGDPPPAGRV
jgi:AcrR family transcriptional regulator